MRQRAPMTAPSRIFALFQIRLPGPMLAS